MTPWEFLLWVFTVGLALILAVFIVVVLVALLRVGYQIARYGKAKK